MMRGSTGTGVVVLASAVWIAFGVLGCAADVAECELDEPLAVSDGRQDAQAANGRCDTEAQVEAMIDANTDPDTVSYDPTGRLWRDSRRGRACYEAAVWDTWVPCE